MADYDYDVLIIGAGPGGLEAARVCAERGRRGLIVAGWSDLVGAYLGDHVRVVDEVVHAEVLPHCAAAVHHGGAGTTAASLRAGLPTLVCAVTADQPFWGERVRALGVGAAVRLSSFTDDDARAGLAVLFDDGTRSAAAALARRMTPADKAVAAAADICEARLT